MALMPHQTKADIKVYKNITLQKLIGLFIAMMMSVLFSNIVHQYLRIPFMIFSVGSYLFLTKKAPDNPQKEYWQGLINFFLFLISRKRYYSLNSKAYKKTLKKEAERLGQRNIRKAPTNYKQGSAYTQRSGNAAKQIQKNRFPVAKQNFSDKKKHQPISAENK